MTKSVKESMKTGVKAFVFLILLSVVTSAFTGDASSGESTDVKATTLTETEVSTSQAAETSIEVTSPTPEQVSVPKKNLTKEGFSDEYKERVREQETEEKKEKEGKGKNPEEISTPEEQSIPSNTDTSSSTVNDISWVSTARSDMAIVELDMQGFATAAKNQDISTLYMYCDMLYTSTLTAINKNDKYSVSFDLKDTKTEYMLAMAAYNWAALMCYDGLKAYDAGNVIGAAESLKSSNEFLTSGNEYMEKFNKLMEVYKEEQ
jgi:hypothetical protein